MPCCHMHTQCLQPKIWKLVISCVHPSTLRVSSLSGNVALSYQEHAVCLPAWVSLAFGIRQKDRLSCRVEDAWLLQVNAVQCDGRSLIVGVRKPRSWP